MAKTSSKTKGVAAKKTSKTNLRRAAGKVAKVPAKSLGRAASSAAAKKASSKRKSSKRNSAPAAKKAAAKKPLAEKPSTKKAPAKKARLASKAGGKGPAGGRKAAKAPKSATVKSLKTAKRGETARPAPEKVTRHVPDVPVRAGTAGSTKPGSKARPRQTEGLDRESRIEELKDQIAQLGGTYFEPNPDMPEGLEEAFLESVLEVETSGWSQPFEILVESGLALPHPDQLGNAEVTEKLWELINALALLNIFLECTDHLSDRELYDHLWTESLREDMLIMPEDPSFQGHTSPIGSGSDEDNEIWLKYYADEDTRQHWVESFPDYVLPDRAKPPYDRDRLLPKPGGEHLSGVH